MSAATPGTLGGQSDVNSNFSCAAGPGGVNCPINNATNLANISAAATSSLSPQGFTGGVQAGYNLQSGSTVFGLETDFNAFDLDKSRSAALPSVTGTGSIFHPETTVDTHWLLTFRGRLGWTVTPTVLLYATGGLAVTEL